MGKDDDVRPLAGRRQPVELDGEILGGGDGDWNAAGFAEVLADFAQGVVALVLVDPDLQGIALQRHFEDLAYIAGGSNYNAPVQRVGEGWGETTGLVEITSMNHGFTVDVDTLPENVEQTHVSLFDGTNCGIAIKGKKAFAVQYHPEASPGPQDSFYLFEKFVRGLG